MRKLKCHEITGIIHCLSGLRIGGSDDLLKSGGADLTYIRHPVSFKPYIPGTSIKGKLRSELEQKEGKITSDGKPCRCLQADCLVCRIFDPHAQTQHQFGPPRIIVRDAQLKDAGEIERKSSTAIDRTTNAALRGALRSEERVAADSTFTFRIGIQVWDLDEKANYENLKKVKKTGGMALVAFVLDGLKLVQRTGLGSGVSKGSGEVQFVELQLDGQSIPEDLW